jgi:catechol-2,3-dioxygenase
VTAGPEIVAATLAVPADTVEPLDAFYGGRLGLRAEPAEGGVAVTAGGARLTFAPVDGPDRPFHHFALLVAGDRFDAACRWLDERARLLPDPATGATVFRFDFWAARACYCHDPAGNIVEVIGHDDIPDVAGSAGPFSVAELLGISEVGLVTTDVPEAARVLERELGLELWSGTREAPGLGFFGRKAHTLILGGVGRGWLPTGRAAKAHAADVTVSGASARQAPLPGARVRVRRVP